MIVEEVGHIWESQGVYTLTSDSDIGFGKDSYAPLLFTNAIIDFFFLACVSGWLHRQVKVGIPTPNTFSFTATLPKKKPQMIYDHHQV